MRVARFATGGLHLGLRRLAAESPPQVLHADGLRALDALPPLVRGPLALRPRPPVVVSLAAGEAGALTAWQRLGLRLANITLADDAVDAALATDAVRGRVRVEVLPEVTGVEAPPSGWSRSALGIPAGAPVIAAIGPLDRAPERYAAVWAFDILRYVRQDAYLILAGDGPEWPAVARFAASAGRDDFRVRFLREPAGPESLGKAFALADFVWVTDPVRGGPLLRAALAEGVPTLAFDTPRAREIAGDAARLVPWLGPRESDKIALVQQTVALMNDPAAAGALAGAALTRGAAFAAPALAARLAALYDSLQAPA